MSLHDDPAAGPGTDPAEGPVTGALAGAVVLVVDDTASKRYVASQWLRRAGSTVLEAETGGRALELAAGGGLDLVVLDVHLPDLSGLEVCRRLRAATATAALPVLHISAVATEVADRVAGLEQGADAYLVDPIDPAELVSTAAVLVRRGRARGAAERLAEQRGRLGTAALRVNAATSAAELVEAAAEGAAAVLGSPALVVAAAEAASWSGATAAPGRRARAVSGTSRTGALLRDLREPALVEAEDPLWSAALPRELVAVRCLVVPVVSSAPSPTAAVVVPASAVPGPAEELLVGQLALVVAVAVENRRRYAEEHRAALELQRSLLPGPHPQLPGLAVATRYSASGEGAEVGGDFYDAFALDDGRAVVVVGDVQGHSLHAAAVMGQLRHSLRALAHEGHVGHSLVARLDRLLDRDHPDLTATVCVVVLDAARTRATVVNAGHIPPLLVVGRVATPVEGGVPLLGVGGVRPEPRGEPPVVDLPPGARLVMVTDGLVERRGEDLGTGMDAVAATVGEHADDDLAALADAVMDRHGRGAQDDAALVAVETGPAAPPGGPGSLSVVLPAEAVSVQRARRFAVHALAGAGLAHLADDAELLVSELAGNAVLHARMPFRLTLELVPGVVRVEVVDLAPALPALVARTTTATTGRGLLLVRSVAARSGTDRAPDGGKRVWFELDGSGPEEPEGSAEDLIAAWAPEPLEPLEPLEALGGVGGGGAPHDLVVVPAVDVRALLAADEHLEDLVREAQLLLLGPAPSPAPADAADAARRVLRLRAARRLDDAVRAALVPRRQLRDAAQLAAADGREVVDVALLVPVSGVDGLRRFREAVDDAERALRGAASDRWSGVQAAFLDRLAELLRDRGGRGSAG